MSPTMFKGKEVTRKRVVGVLRDFDARHPNTNDYDRWLEKRTYKYALQYGDTLYPPKHILSQATDISTAEFGGGEETNRVFRQLGFTITGKEEFGGRLEGC